MNKAVIKLLLSGCFCLLGIFAFAQNVENTNYEGKGKLTVEASTQVDSLLALHRMMNAQYPNIPGYRIQIFFESGNNSKSKAMQVYKGFVEKYPDQTAYISFAEPNYRVRVGDFRTRLEAEEFLRKIEGSYKGAWIGSDRINYPSMGEKRQTTTEEVVVE